MKKTIVLCFLSLFLVKIDKTYSCTAFKLPISSGFLIGNNYDWISPEGFILVNQRNVNKTAFGFTADKAVTWNSKYGSITFNQYGKEFPQGGMNEKGLVVITLVLSETVYPNTSNEDKIINEAQWIQYQLDNFASVDELISNIEKIKIKAFAINLHYYVADASGKVAIIEFLDGKIVVNNNSKYNLNVITNSTAENSEYFYKNKYKSVEKFPPTSLNRFSRAVELIEKHKLLGEQERRKEINYSFDILKSVFYKGWTVWSIVYDVKEMKIYWKSTKNKTVKWISLADFDFSKPTSMLNIDIKEEGNAKALFTPFDKEKNKAVIWKTYNRLQFTVTKEEFNKLNDFQVEPSNALVFESFNDNVDLVIEVKGFEPIECPSFIGLMNNARNHRKIYPYRGAEIPVKNGKVLWTVYNIPPGEYSAACYQDINDNDKADLKCFFVMKEPIGFSNNPKSCMPIPPFKKAKFKVLPVSNNKLMFEVKSKK